MVLGDHVVLCMTVPYFLKIIFDAKMVKIGEALGSLNVWESLVSFLNFLIFS